MSIIDAHATADGRAVRCDIDGCTAVLVPGERSTPPGPWATDQAIEAALTQGWLIDIFTPGADRCPDHERVAIPERTDLYLALSIINDARHAICGPGKKVANTEAVLFGEDATRLVRLLSEMKHDAAVGQIPVRLAIHQHHDRGGRS